VTEILPLKLFEVLLGARDIADEIAQAGQCFGVAMVPEVVEVDGHPGAEEADRDRSPLSLADVGSNGRPSRTRTQIPPGVRLFAHPLVESDLALGEKSGALQSAREQDAAKGTEIVARPGDAERLYRQTSEWLISLGSVADATARHQTVLDSTYLSSSRQGLKLTVRPALDLGNGTVTALKRIDSLAMAGFRGRVGDMVFRLEQKGGGPRTCATENYIAAMRIPPSGGWIDGNS
jgi:hypothetical protein